MPLVNRTFDQLIDFTRTSAATYVNNVGLVTQTPASRNLLTYSQEFDNAAWAKNNVTITANSTTAPDGTTTADTITASAGAAVHNTQQSASVAAQGAASFYVKAGTHNFVQILFGPNSNIYANFNVSTGVVGTVGSSATASISAIGDGWYRCAIVCTPGSAGNFRLAMISSNTSAFNESWTAAGTETIFAWGAQVENGSTATTYTRNYGGVYPPRFDYDPVTLAPKGLLVEEQRTNLLLRSEQFDNASWTKNNATISANATTSPDGTTDADKLVENTAASVFHYANQVVTKAASAIQYTATCYVKDAGRQVQIYLQSGSNGVAGRVNPADGTVTSAAAAFGAGWTAGTLETTSVGNGWWRVTLVATSDTTTSIVLQFALHNGSTNVYTGDGTSGVLLYGAQLEAGAFATSYIPTVASQVTRTADVATMTGTNFASWFNSLAGTIVASVLISSKSPSSYGIYAVDDGTTNNAFPSFYTGAAIANSRVSGSNVFTSTSEPLSATPGVLNVAFAYQNADYASSFNGATPTTQASGAVPSGLNRLQLGVYNNAQLNGWVRSLRYYPVRLTNAQLQALTA